MHQCNLCKRTFSTKSNLNRHHATIKMCNQPQPQKKIFSCAFCDKELSSKQMLSYHQHRCKKNVKIISTKPTKAKEDEKYNNLQQQILELKKELEETKNRTTNNITINTTSIGNTTIDNSSHHYGNIMTYMTKELVQETFEKNYTLEDFFGSQKALAEFTTKNFLMGKDKALYLCKDKSRKRFIYTDEEQNEIEDLNAAILIKLVSKGFGTIEKLYKKESMVLHSRLSCFEKEDYTEMIIQTREQIKKLETVYKQIINIIKEGDGYRNQLCRSLPSSLEHRINIDSNSEQLKEEESDSEQSVDPTNSSKQAVLYDTNVRNIGGISYGKLRLYKNHYQRSCEIIIPKVLMENEEHKRLFLEFIHSDE